jgi:hypothetical protein
MLNPNPNWNPPAQESLLPMLAEMQRLSEEAHHLSEEISHRTDELLAELDSRTGPASDNASGRAVSARDSNGDGAERENARGVPR